jgi:hypothetical protein
VICNIRSEGNGLRLFICACYLLEVALNVDLGYHSVMYRTGKEFGRKRGI